MGLLDELQEEAEKHKADTGQIDQQKAEREEAYKTVIEPQMAALHEYLTKLVEHIKVVKPNFEFAFELTGYGAVAAAVDHDYELRNVVVQNKSAREIEYVVNATVIQEKCPTVEVSSPIRLKSMQSAFERVKLAGMQNVTKNEQGEAIGGTYRARGKIRQSANFFGDADTGMLRITFNNIDGFGTVTKTVAPAAIDDKLFDGIGRYLTRKSFELMREKLSEDVRSQLKNSVAQQQLRRTWENKILDLQQEELPRLRREFSFFARLSNAFADWKTRKKREQGQKSKS